jgi:ferritin-like metal-binding protein YciE
MTLHEMLVDELRELYHAEKQLTKALPKLAKAATHDGLRDAFESHLEETREHVTRLEEVFGSLDEPAKAKPCPGMAGIVEEGSELLQEDAEGAVLDAALIAAAQRAEHYEIGAYGSCVAWARLLGHSEAVALLEQTLEEEKAADGKLTSLAESEINQAAAAEEQAEEDDSSEGTGQRPESRSSNRGQRRVAGATSGSRAKAADRRRR